MFHDFLGKDFTVKINEKFNSDISPYIVDGMVIGGVSSVLSLLFFSNVEISNTQLILKSAFIISNSIIQGFVMGVTAALGAYCGDYPDKCADEDDATELTNNELTDTLIH